MILHRSFDWFLVSLTTTTTSTSPSFFAAKIPIASARERSMLFRRSRWFLLHTSLDKFLLWSRYGSRHVSVQSTHAGSQFDWSRNGVDPPFKNLFSGYADSTKLHLSVMELVFGLDATMEDQEMPRMLRSCYLYALFEELRHNRGEQEGTLVCSRILKVNQEMRWFWKLALRFSLLLGSRSAHSISWILREKRRNSNCAK